VSCPCGRPLSYEECCAPAHRGSAPPTAEALMRSRYSAYVRDDTAYLLRSWHPDTRPAALEREPGLRWTGLEVVESTGGGLFDAEGVVEFRARYVEHGRPGEMRERSRFVRHDGAWVYWAAMPVRGATGR
jgi:SEC-C motif-containing protein